MATVTLRLLDGADRGRVFESLPTPVTIGREEGNTIQLNDERVSRYHIKIQEDNEKLVLTDLESTNGTKVNGEDIQIRILRYGDLVTVGRSVLLFGSRNEIAERLARVRQNGDSHSPTEKGDLQKNPEDDEGDALDYELSLSNDPELQATLHLLEPPELPDRLSPAQAAQLAEMLDYLHIRLRKILASGRLDETEKNLTLDFREWQDLIDFQTRVATYLRSISDPDKD
ncbi:MAG: FHA domain-containing protein [Pirellulaceae bacterium]|nr:FHA domain-containing protein [Pirellulaceae bacterium]